VDVAYTISRMRVLERIPGNPVSIAFHEIDTATVFASLQPRGRTARRT
jgi:hypothetical protein